MALGIINYTKPRLPEWGGVPNPNNDNNNATTPREYQATISGEGSIIPVVYGNVEVGLRIVDVKIYGSFLCFIGVLAEGPIQSVDSYRLNGQDLNSTSIPRLATHNTFDAAADVYITPVLGGDFQDTLGSTEIMPGISFARIFNSAPNGLSPWGYNKDAMRGTSYLVVCCKSGVFSGFPQITATVKGKRVYSPQNWVVDSWNKTDNFLKRTNFFGARFTKTSITEASIADVQNYIRYSKVVGDTSGSSTSAEDIIDRFLAPSEAYTVDLWLRKNNITNDNVLSVSAGAMTVEVFVRENHSGSSIPCAKLVITDADLETYWKKFTLEVPAATFGTQQTLYLNFDIDSGSICCDSGPVIVTPVEYSDGYCLGLNSGTATGGYGVIANSYSLNQITTAFTVEAWINPESLSADATLLAHIDATGSYSYIVAYIASSSAFALVAVNSSGTMAFTGVAISDPSEWLNKWNHLAFSYDGNNLYCLVNGKVVNTVAFTGQLKAITGNIYVGAFLGVLNHYKGKISHVRLWNKYRTAEEIASNIYTELDANTDPKLLFNHPFTLKPLTSESSSNNVRADGTQFLNHCTLSSYTTAAVAVARDRIHNYIFEPTKYPKWSNAMNFDGTTAQKYLSIAHNIDILNAYSNKRLTVEMWVKFNPGVAECGLFDLSYENNTNRNFLIFLDNAGDLKIKGRVIYTGLSATTVQHTIPDYDKLWHHVACVLDTSSISLYVNGTLASTSALTATLNAASASGGGIRIGLLWGNLYPHKGYIDDVRIWSTARTAEEIATFYQKRLYGNEENLLSYYSFDEWYDSYTLDYGRLQNHPTLTATTGVAYPTHTNGIYLSGNSGKIYSNCPADCLADFIISNKYGAAKDVDWVSVLETAVLNNGPVSGVGSLVYSVTPGGQATDLNHRKLDIVIDKPNFTSSWLDTLRSYTGCFLHLDNLKYGFIPNYPCDEHPVTVTPDNILRGTFGLKKAGISNIPNSVEIQYTDTSTVPWGTRAVTASSVLENETVRSSSVSLPGITRYSQAVREAKERLNSYGVCDLAISFGMVDDAVQYSVGNVIRVHHLYFGTPWSLLSSSKLFRISNISKQDLGRYSISALEYNSDVYNSSLNLSVTEIPDTNNSDPFSTPTVSSVVVSEDIVKGDNGIYATRLNISWTPPSDVSKVGGYYVKVKHVSGAVRIDGSGSTLTSYPYVVYEYDIPSYNTTSVLTGVLAEQYVEGGVTANNLYDIEVYCKNAINTSSLTNPFIVSNRSLTGKTTPPTAPTNFSVYEVGGEVRLSWDPASDLDLAGYELRYSTTDITEFTAATLLNKVDALRYVTKEISPGWVKFWIRSFDSGGRVSSHLTAIIEVTSDSGSFNLDNREFGVEVIATSGTSSATSGGYYNMEYVKHGRTDTLVRYITQDTRSISTALASPIGDYVNPLATHHENITSIWRPALADYINLGSEISGTWLGKSNYFSLIGCGTATSGSSSAVAVSAYIELANSPTATAWNAFALTGKKDSGIYGRLNYRTIGTGTLYVVGPGNSIKIDSIPLEESGVITAGAFASGKTTVTLQNKYASASEILVLPKSTGTADMSIAAYDNIRLAPLYEGDYLQIKTDIITNASTYAYINIIGGSPTATGYAVGANEFLCYDVYIDPIYSGVTVPYFGIGGIELEFSNTAGGTVTDYLRVTYVAGGIGDIFVEGSGGGYLNSPAVWGPGTTAGGRWISCKVRITGTSGGLVGKYVRHCMLVDESDTASGETHIAYFKNIRIVDNSNIEKAIMWRTASIDGVPSGWPTGSFQLGHNTSGNGVAFQRNRFDIWLTTPAGAATAKDVYYKFKGI